MTRTGQITRLTRLALLLSNGRIIGREHNQFVSAWLRFAASELKKPPPATKLPNHRPRGWEPLDALLIFGMKVIHGQQDETKALGDIANAFGLKSTRTISENAEFKAGKARMLEFFRRAHYVPRVKK